jgi:antitoxin component of MazEF toxin-antitoxin module
MNRRDATATKNGGSVSVVLPPDWLRGHGIRKGSPLEVRYGELLLIVPPGKSAAADRLLEAAGGRL